MRYFLFFVLWSFLGSSWGQELTWTPFSNLNDSLRKKQKPIMIFVHTDWCKYCKLQENTSFKDSAVVTQLNQHFYCLKLDAESQESLSFFNKKYEAMTDEYHDLAQEFMALAQSKSFPITIFIDENLTDLKAESGHLNKIHLLDRIKLLTTKPEGAED